MPNRSISTVETFAGGDKSSFHFDWVEKGGPRVVKPELSRMGFGTRLIERMLKNDFGGEVTIDFRADGLVCTLVAPLEKLTEPEYRDV
jgi:two-component sensor histidine kinase